MVYTPGLWLFALATFLIVTLLGYGWRFRKEETGREFLFLMLCALFWLAGFTAETALPTLQGKLATMPVQFLGITLIPAAWLFLVLAYTRRPITIRWRFFILLIPGLTNLVLWTNPLHQWFIGSPHIQLDLAPFPVLVQDYQFWFYFIHAPVSYLVVLAAFLLMAQFFIRISPTSRRQAGLLMLSLLLPTITDVLYVLGYSPIPFYNITTAIFSISGCILVWTLFRFRFLDLHPLARDTIIDNLNVGVLVIDHKNRIMEINPAAQRAFHVEELVLGMTISQVKNNSLRAIAEIIHENRAGVAVEFSGPAERHFELQVSPVRTAHKVQIGWVVTSHDITERVHLFRQVQTMSHQDSLTGIANRRYFLEMFQRALEAVREKREAPLSVVMMDVDYFKTVNDTFGHGSGDSVLIAMTLAIKTQLRKDDLFGRLGGEEFAILLKDVQPKDAFTIVERLRETIENLRIPGEHPSLRITASFGIASTQNLTDDEMVTQRILHLADQALYHAKRKGRNRVIAYERASA